MELVVIEDVPQGCASVQLCGDLDVVSAPYLRERLLLILDRLTPDRLILDLSNLDFMDSSGTAVLVGVERRARLTGCTFALVAPQQAVRRVLQICGLDHHFLIFPNVTAATEATQADHPPSRVGCAASTGEADRATP